MSVTYLNDKLIVEEANGKTTVCIAVHVLSATTNQNKRGNFPVLHVQTLNEDQRNIKNTKGLTFLF